MHRNRPLIGICAYEVPASFSHWRNVDCVMVPAGYVRGVAEAGGIPLVIPPLEQAGELAETLDGLLLTGGSDIDPALYGQPPHAETTGVVPHRDRAELELLRAALERDLPVLGVCRGLQLLNVLRGGTLVQHLADVVPDGGVHKGPPGTFTRHPVQVDAGSRLHGIVGDRLDVPSCHHQAPDRIGEGLVVTAHAPDGVIEAVELPQARFCVAVLWHPEEDLEGGGMPLFRELVAQAARPVTV
ncbi:MAG: putative glutamine amidotransferase [Gaiellales bacterium]|jgi:gamma-glutamyl-gamma-aminobutyrate hydrolase PuuD|nr:putative glutamine amidotransferase [Gaiellales bacterium]